MPSTISLIKRLRIDYPQFIFKKASNFLWSHSDHTIYYANMDGNYNGFLLHELSHGILNHTNYNRDVELIAMESEAWDKTKELAVNYGVLIDDDFIQSTLDTYRDWLHKRSTSPKCQATGLQTKTYTYTCLVCGHSWRVNEAKTCALRRYSYKS